MIKTQLLQLLLTSVSFINEMRKESISSHTDDTVWEVVVNEMSIIKVRILLQMSTFILQTYIDIYNIVHNSCIGITFMGLTKLLKFIRSPKFMLQNVCHVRFSRSAKNKQTTATIKLDHIFECLESSVLNLNNNVTLYETCDFRPDIYSSKPWLFSLVDGVRNDLYLLPSLLPTLGKYSVNAQ